ncbi:MinD/ParA family ATP-binding protein [Microbacterium shaanxiense]
MSGATEEPTPSADVPAMSGDHAQPIISRIPPMAQAIPPVPPLPSTSAEAVDASRDEYLEQTYAAAPATPADPPQYRRSSFTAQIDDAPAAGADLPSRRQQREQQERKSFLQTERPEEPASEGARGALNRMGFKLAPNAAEQSARNDELAVSQHWPGPRTIAVVNGKGGAGKTPTTILLSAVFARYGGAGVLAWDNNQTRGTLGWRTEAGAHDRTLLEMIPEAERLLGTGAQSADLAHFVHHQPREKYDVLRSKPIRLAHENRLRPEDVDAIHAVATKFYRLIIIDSGNDESDPMWLRMIDRADQIVVATTTRADHAEAGALLLEALEERDDRSAQLARQSVVVVSQADPKASAADIEHVVGGYRALAREVVSIPFDHEMVDGHLRYGALAKRTQRAWLSAAASVARGL